MKELNMMNLTEASKELFTKIVRDLGNWSGVTPCYNHITKESRGNLTQLKRAGLVFTFHDNGEEWIQLTVAGMVKANDMGIGNLHTDLK